MLCCRPIFFKTPSLMINQRKALDETKAMFPQLHQKIEEAKAKLGPRFTLGDFHEAVLGTGRVPLEILEAETRRWLANA